ncbi:hypothetical protein ACQP1G_32740 [Nocardia sp. CA-107356]|uniref:hypothetical protein n=1 Tax=Nocardia sp. CA-107356 TaxID=3239972 RepID=UPI003D8D4FA3
MMWLERSHEPDTEDYGLLVAAATVANAATAHAVRDLLRYNGIRATIGAAHAIRRPGHQRVLVFPEDAVRAYEILCDNTV